LTFSSPLHVTIWFVLPMNNGRVTCSPWPTSVGSYSPLA
jgi:hypothetical protein